jgi:hypothetical protein
MKMYRRLALRIAILIAFSVAPVYSAPKEAPHAKVVQPTKRFPERPAKPPQKDVPIGFQVSTGAGVRWIVPQLRLGVEAGNKNSPFFGLIFDGFGYRKPGTSHWNSLTQLNLRVGKSVMGRLLTTRSYFELGGGYLKTVGGDGLREKFITIGFGLTFLRWVESWLLGVDFGLRGYMIDHYMLPIPGVMFVVGRHYTVS